MQDETLYIFDLDDTLVRSNNENLAIYIQDEHGKEVNRVSYVDYLENGLPQLPEGHWANWREFSCAYTFFATAQPVPQIVNIAQQVYYSGADAVILTARSHFDDRALLKQAFEVKNIPDFELLCAGFAPVPSNPEKKCYMLDKIVKPKHRNVVIYDDRMDNILGMREWCYTKGLEVEARHVEVKPDLSVVITVY